VDATSLPVRFESQRNAARVTLTPEINQVPWDIVEQCGDRVVAGLQECRATSLLVDLTPLDFLGSAQVALLARIWKALSAQQGKMVVHVTSPVVRDVLKTAGLHRLWRIVDSHEQGLEKLGVNESGVQVVPVRWTVFPGLTAVISLILAAISWKGPEDWRTWSSWAALASGGLAVFLSRRAVLRAEQGQRALGFLSLLVGLGAAATGGLSNWRNAEHEVKIVDPEKAAGVKIDDPLGFGDPSETSPTSDGMGAANPEQPNESTPLPEKSAQSTAPAQPTDSQSPTSNAPETPQPEAPPGTSKKAPAQTAAEVSLPAPALQNTDEPQRPAPPEEPLDSQSSR